MRRLLTLALLLPWLGCTGKDEQSPVQAPTPLTEHRLRAAAEAHRKVGESCAQGGASECLSGLCLHVKPDPADGWFCSTSCTASRCPEGWACNQLTPGASDSVCVPPPSWAGQAARLN